MIRYFREDTSFDFKNRRLNNSWLKEVIISEEKVPGNINYIFCSDEYLLDINKKFLSHDYYTDVITFDYCEDDLVSGDVFISVDSVRDNAAHYGVTFERELDRVMVHGVLHLIGYDDHCDQDIAEMRAKEDHYIERKYQL